MYVLYVHHCISCFDPSLALYSHDNIIYMFALTFQHLLYKIVVFLLVALP